MSDDAGDALSRTSPAKTAIQNPLALVGVFAGFAETCATVVMLQLKEPEAHMFIWFVMGFPILIVVLFFTILYVRPLVFYNPADVGMKAFVDHIEKITRRDVAVTVPPTSTGRKASRKLKLEA